jgi:hypothetical protein
MNCTEIEEQSGCEIVYVHGATASELVTFLDSTVPWVWILGHCSHPLMQWWDATVPLNSTGAIFTGRVRSLCLDLQMLTHEFVARATEFDGHGLELIQSYRQMPDTLNLESVPEWQRTEILIQSGATLRIDLPHAVETAQVQCFVKGYLATIPIYGD